MEIVFTMMSLIPSVAAGSQNKMSAVALITLTLAFGVLIPESRAGLDWAQKRVELEAIAGTEVLEAHFHFTNNGSTPLDIRQVESSCGCTSADLSQRHYEPHQSGEIVAKYKVEGHMGVQTKTLAVFSSDLPEPTTLTLVIHIPEIAHLQPTFVTWAHDEAGKPKVILLEMLQEVSPKDISVQSSNPMFAVEVESVIKGRKYQLVVTPTQTSQFGHAILTVHCRFGDKEQTFRSYATIQPPVPHR